MFWGSSSYRHSMGMESYAGKDVRSNEHQDFLGTDFLGTVWQEAGCLEEGPHCLRWYKSWSPFCLTKLSWASGTQKEGTSLRLVTGDNCSGCRKLHLPKHLNLSTETSSSLHTVVSVESLTHDKARNVLV